MKFKRFFAIALAICMALSLAAVLTACDDPTPEPEPDEATISYQFFGYNDELYSYGWAYTVMLNLWSDGTVTGSGYNYLREQNGLKEKWFRGSWSEKQDEDAGKFVELKAIWGDDATNDQNGQSTTGRIEKYSLYFDDDGKTLLTFTLKIPLMSERNAEMECYVPAKYADVDAFVTASKEFGESHKPGGGEEENYGNAIATLKAEDNKEAIFYDSGVVVIDTGYTKPVLAWKYENGAFTFTETDGNNKGQVTTDAVLAVEGTTGTLTYNFMSRFEFTYTGDISALIGAEAEPVVLATLKTADNKEAVFYSNGTVKLDTGIPQLSPVWNWKYENNTITFTEEGKTNAPDGVTFTIDGTTGSLVYAPAFMQGASFTYTGDISALIA